MVEILRVNKFLGGAENVLLDVEKYSYFLIYIYAMPDEFMFS